MVSLIETSMQNYDELQNDAGQPMRSTKKQYGHNIRGF